MAAIRKYRLCPDCHRYISYLQPRCDCGHRFDGSERMFKTCPSCGLLVHSGKLLCDCGHFFLFDRRMKITRQDLDDAYNSGLSAGLQQERARQEDLWAQFFQDAQLKNTISGDPIRCLDDFQKWKSAYDAAKAQRDLRARQEEARRILSQPYPDAPWYRDLAKLAGAEYSPAKEGRKSGGDGKIRFFIDTEDGDHISVPEDKAQSWEAGAGNPTPHDVDRMSSALHKLAQSGL